MSDDRDWTRSTPDLLAHGLRVAFGEDREQGSSVLQQLEVSGVHLPDSDASDGVPVVIDEATRALRDPGGRYQVLGEIGRGGVGIVYKGRDVDLGRDVAMKVLREEHASSPEILARFVEEAQIGGQLQHPGIVPVYELGLQRGQRPYFAMKLIRGETLAALLGRRKAPDEERARFLGIFEQVCQTIAYAHARSVVHRDLKPANVMIGAFGEVQVVDWGLAKILPRGGVADEALARDGQHAALDVISSVRSGPGSGGDSMQGSMMGTPAYMSPEQAQGDIARVGRSSDVFALGAILCEILSGKPPYASHDPLRQASRGDLESCHARLDRSGADPALIALCKECLSPGSQDRPASAQEVAARVRDHLSSVEERARKAQLHAAEAKIRARATLGLSAAALLLLLVGGGGYLFLQQQAQARKDRAEQRVAAALTDANVRFGKASAGGDVDAGLWELAIDAGVRAEQLASDPDVATERRGKAGELLAALRAGQSQALARAEQLARIERLRLGLLRLRIPSDSMQARTPGWRMRELERVDRAYADVFREFLGGRNLADMQEADAVSSLRGEVAVEVSAALSLWASVHGDVVRSTPGGSELTARLRSIAAQLDPDDPWRAQLRSLAAEPRSRRSEIEKLAAAADLERLPVQSLLLLASALGRADADEAGISILRQGCDLHPQDLGLCIRLAAQLERSGRTSEAAAQYRTALALRPDLREARHRLGEMLATLGEFEAGERIFRALVQEDGDNGHWYFHLGNCQDGNGKSDEAIDSYRRAIAINPSDATSHGNLGATLARQGRNDEALVELRRAVELEPDDPQKVQNLGLTLWHQGQSEEAADRFRRATELDPQYGLAHASLGEVLLNQGKLDEAIASLCRAVQADPKSAAAQFDLGSAYELRGDFGSALESMRKAQALAGATRVPGTSTLSSRIKDAVDRIAARLAEQGPR